MSAQVIHKILNNTKNILSKGVKVPQSLMKNINIFINLKKMEN